MCEFAWVFSQVSKIRELLYLSYLLRTESWSRRLETSSAGLAGSASVLGEVWGSIRKSFTEVTAVRTAARLLIQLKSWRSTRRNLGMDRTHQLPVVYKIKGTATYSLVSITWHVLFIGTHLLFDSVLFPLYEMWQLIGSILNFVALPGASLIKTT